jgi:hypothetical protein
MQMTPTPEIRLDLVRLGRGRRQDEIEVEVSRRANKGSTDGGRLDGDSPRGRIVEAIF